MAQKEKLCLEYIVNTSPKVLFPRLSTASGLSEWFADNVNVNGEIYTFFWDGSEQRAKKVSQKDLKYVRFQWIEDEEEGEDVFFEFKLEVHDLTGEIALLVTDFADEDEKDETVELWDSQINDLKRILGT